MLNKYGLGLLAIVLLTLPMVEAAEPGRDAIGDALPEGAKARMGTLRWRIGRYTNFMAFLPDNDQLLTADYRQGSFQVWKTGTGIQLRRFGKPKSTVYRYSMTTKLSPDGRLVAGMGGQARSTRMWEVASGKMLWQKPPRNTSQYEYPLAFSADSKMFATRGPDRYVRLWEATTGKETAKLDLDPKKEYITYLVFAPNGRTVATRGSRNSYHIFDVATGKLLRKFSDTTTLKYVTTLVYSPDSRTLAAVGRGTRDGVVLVWEVETGKQVRKLTNLKRGNAFGISASADGRKVAWVGVNGSVEIYDLSSGKKTRDLGKPPAGTYFYAPLFSPDGKYLACRDNRSRYYVWETATGKEKLRSLVPGYYFAFSHDGKRFAALTSGGTNRVVSMWDVEAGASLSESQGHQGEVFALAPSVDSKTLITLGQDQTVRRWNMSTGKEVARHNLGSPIYAYTAALSRDGKLVAFGSRNNNNNILASVQLTSIATGKKVGQIPLTRPGNIYGLAFSPDGKRLATMESDYVLRLFDTLKCAPAGKFTPPVVPNVGGAGGIRYSYNNLAGIVFSPDGKRVATAWNAYSGRNRFNAVYVQSVPAGRVVTRFQTENNATVSSIVFSPDGLNCAIVNKGVRTSSSQPQVMPSSVSILETVSGRVRAKIKGPAATVAFSDDGKFLAIGTDDGKVRLRSVRRNKELKQFSGHQDVVQRLIFSADKTLVSGSKDTTAMVWDIADSVAGLTPSKVNINEKQLSQLWSELAHQDASKAYGAIIKLSQAPQQTVPLFEKRLKPVVGVSPKHIQQLIGGLDSNKFQIRQHATQELEKLGELAEPALKDLLAKQTPLEVRLRVEQILAKLEGAAPPPPDLLRAIRALEVLQEIGTPEARKVMMILAEGADGARLTREAQASLERSSPQTP